MERVLVVIDDTDTYRDVLEEAASVAGRAGAELVLFSWVTPSEFEADIEALEAAEQVEGARYSDQSPADIVGNFVSEFVADVLGEDAPDYELAAAVTEDDERADEILAAAERHDCDHIYIAGRRRSPTGKVLFGDVAQQVILNFDGYVTITTN